MPLVPRIACSSPRARRNAANRDTFRDPAPGAARRRSTGPRGRRSGGAPTARSAPGTPRTSASGRSASRLESLPLELFESTQEFVVDLYCGLFRLALGGFRGNGFLDVLLRSLLLVVGLVTNAGLR